jgi:hypothetical protein
MVASLIRLALIALAVNSVRADLQLTPSISEYELEGVKFKQLAFHDGEKQPTYQPPRGWDYAGSGDRLTLHPPGKSQAEGAISRVAPPEHSNSTEDNSKKLVAEAIASVPKGSSAVTVISQQASPLRISGKEAFQVVLSYSLLGQTFDRSILFLNRDRDQLRFQFVAREPDFKDLQSAFQKSLCTWRNL